MTESEAGDEEIRAARARVEITAHRGDPLRAPENTLPSLSAAAEAGADAVEWDVRICRSGTPMVIHDATVERTTNGTGAVADLSEGELRRLDAGAWFSEAHAGTRIPTLDEVLELVAEAGVDGCCEVKALRGPDDAGPILGALRRHGLLERTAVISLEPEILRAFRRRDPDVRLGWLVFEEAGMAPALDRVREDLHGFLGPEAGLLVGNPARTRDLLEEGISLGTWTVDETDTADTLLDLGVTRMTTNRVRELLAWAGRPGRERGARAARRGSGR